MKKLLLLLTVISLITATSFGQVSVKLPLAAGDTIVNTGTSSKVLQVTTAPSGVVLHVVLTKISGTGAGTVQLQGANDGVNYVNIGSAYTITNTATQSTLFTVTAPVPQYLKVLATGSGTESVQQVVWYRAPKYQPTTP
jgi:hypothetical protein